MSLTVAQASSLWDVEPGYLNSSSYGPPPRPAWDAFQRALDDWRAGRTSWEPWADSVEVSRQLFAALVGADPGQVATGASVSQLLAPVAAAVPDGTRVLVPDIEFTSNVFPWAVHADRGVSVVSAPVDRAGGGGAVQASMWWPSPPCNRRPARSPTSRQSSPRHIGSGR